MVTRTCPNVQCPDIELFGVRGEYPESINVCPKCGTKLVSESVEIHEETSSHYEYRKLVPLCIPDTSSELAVVKSLLQAEGIFFFVHNEFFGSMKVGISIPLFNQRTVLVADQDLEQAREVVTPPDSLKREAQRRYGALDKVRMLIEGLFLGWVIPNPRHPYPREHVGGVAYDR